VALIGIPKDVLGLEKTKVDFYLWRQVGYTAKSKKGGS
jgi:hypothetical protein